MHGTCTKIKKWLAVFFNINPLNAELNPIRHLLVLVGARHMVHVSRIRVNQECGYLCMFRIETYKIKTGKCTTWVRFIPSP